MAVNWTTDLIRRGLDLRINHELSWEDVAKMLAQFEPNITSKDQPRIKLNRVLAKDPGEAGYVPVPEPGEYEWDFSCLDAPVEEKAAPYEVTDPYREQDYLFDGESYIFRINGKDYAFPKDVWESIVADYSDLGGRLTRQEIAIKYGGNFKIIEAALRKYGHFKASPPATREELAEAVRNGEDFTPLMDRAVEMAQRSFQVKLSRHYVRSLEQEVRKLQRELFERGTVRNEVRSVIEALEADFPTPNPVSKVVVREGEPFTYFAPLFDTHIGLQTFAERGWTTDYSSDIAVQYIREHGRESAQLISERVGYCKQAILGLGGDILHSVRGQTLSGRHVGQDRPDRFLVRAAVQAFIDWIEAVRPYAEKVRVLGIGGNHDGFLGEIVVDFLAMYYRDAEDVEVDDRPEKRAYFIEGETLHVLDHGENFKDVTGTKALALAERIARRVAGTDYYRVRRIVFYVGHMHHREGAKTPALDAYDKTQGHLEIIRVPVFCSASEFEEVLGFWNEQMSDSFFLNSRGRIKGIERVYAEDLVLPHAARYPVCDRAM